jgi:hypothetical protein
MSTPPKEFLKQAKEATSNGILFTTPLIESEKKHQSKKRPSKPTQAESNLTNQDQKSTKRSRN